MVNRSKAKGTAAETRVVNYLLAAGVEARRVVMKGQHDQGDIHFFAERLHGLLEVKGGKQTQRVSRGQKEEWLKEARVEGINADLVPYLVIAKHGASVKDYEVWSSGGVYFFYLDQFVKWISHRGESE
jgi:hypothetical protein